MIGVRYEAVGISHDPLASLAGREALRRGIDSEGRDVDTMRIEAGLPGERAQVEAIPAAGIENHVVATRSGNLSDGAQQRSGHAEVVQSPTRRDRGLGVAGLLGSPVLRLEKVDIPAARYVERMGALAEQ